MSKLLLVWLSLVLLQPIYGQSRNNNPVFQQTPISGNIPDFSAIDDHVLQLKSKKNISNEALVQEITQLSKTPTEKARAIFMWIANNIAYDTNFKIRTKEDAIKQRKGVCEAYSGLFEEFARIAGLEAISISGDSKQYYYKKPSDLDRGGHAWNAVKVENDRWLLLDATWGAGHVNNQVFTKKLSTFWFDPDPEIYIFSHYPKETQWQLLYNPVDKDDFLRLPPLYPNLVLWGFNSKNLLDYFQANDNTSFPDIYSIDLSWKINQMPILAQLEKDKSYTFEFELTENEEVAIIINNKDWHRFEKNGNIFSTVFTPEKKGTAVIAVKQQDGKFAGVFKYTIL
ncbi:MAG: hypothetical protein LBQ60_00865 [Bacteroidales bacterium]|jgi:hypothetical protein|nr:hypothetical protein [Bacteroidales bacterium]